MFVSKALSHVAWCRAELSGLEVQGLKCWRVYQLALYRESLLAPVEADARILMARDILDQAVLKTRGVFHRGACSERTARLARRCVPPSVATAQVEVEDVSPGGTVPGLPSAEIVPGAESCGLWSLVLLSFVFVRRHVWGVDVWSSRSFAYVAVCVGLLSCEHATARTCVFPPCGVFGLFPCSQSLNCSSKVPRALKTKVFKSHLAPRPHLDWGEVVYPAF